MIIFDANVLITLVCAREGDDAYERLLGLIQELAATKTVIGVPAPAWAEFLCGTDAATVDIVNALKRRSAMRILAFDEVSALEASMIYREALASGNKRGASKAPWQKVKVDRQILSIARQHNASFVVTDDDDMIAEASRLGVKALRPLELPRPPVQDTFIFGVDSDPPPSPGKT